MTKHDIQKALEWLSWRLDNYNRKYSSEFLDKMAAQHLRNVANDPLSSDEAKDIAILNIQKIPHSAPAGAMDKTCNNVCKQIIILSSEADFVQMLANNPRKIVAWRTLWNKIRANKMRKI